MDETEQLEEGEACVCQKDDDTRIDPDVALSYMDEKIQNVLGHFKKDFEGLVSVENLGAKYGIYGSFLPMYRRSPVSSHSRSPSRVQNRVASQSPSSLRAEDGRNTSAQAKTSHSARPGPDSSLAYNPSSQNNLGRQTTKAQLMQSLEECTPKSEACDRKTLKVRIKVGSDNLSVKKNTAIYSGLGLDGSPSSSIDGSPLESKGLLHGTPFEACQSPTQILQMMTSFPLYGSYLLSPLPYDLIQLSERPKVLQGILTKTSLENNQKKSAMGHRKGNKTCSGDSVLKQVDVKGLSLQVKRDGKDSCIGFDFSLKESDIDALSCEELISNALKLPLLSNADSIIHGSSKASLKEKVYSETAKGEPLVPGSIDGSLNHMQNEKANFVRTVACNKSTDTPNETIGGSGKTHKSKGEAANISSESGTVCSHSNKASKSEPQEPLKQDGKSISGGGKGQLSSGNKKKPKKSKGHGFATESEAVKNAEGRAWELKDRNCTYTENLGCRSELKSSSTQKELSKQRDKYEEFFGDLNEQEADLMDSEDVPVKDRLMTSQKGDMDTLVCENTMRERTISSEISRGAGASIDLKGPSHNFDLSEEIDKCKADTDFHGGHGKTSMIKSKRKPDEDYRRVSKKNKRRGIQAGDNNCATAQDESKGTWAVSTDDESTCPLAEPLLDGKSDGRNFTRKKRKADHVQDSPNSTPSSGKLKSVSEEQHFNKKKCTVPKPEEKGYGTRNAEADKRDNNILQHSLDNAEPLRIDSSHAESSLPATSGSKSIVEEASGHDAVKLAMDSPAKFSNDDHKGRSVQSGHVRKDVTEGGIHNRSVKPSLNDSQEKTKGSLQSGLTKISASKIHRNRCDDNLGPNDGDHKDAPTLDKCVNEAFGSESLPSTNLSCLGISDNDCSSLDKDKKKMPKNIAEEGQAKMSEFYDNPQDEKPVLKDNEGGNKSRDPKKCGSNVSKSLEDETKSSMKIDADKKPENLASTSKRVKSQCVLPSDVGKNEISSCPQPYQRNGLSTSSADTSASDLPKEQKPNKKADIQNGTYHTTSKHLMPYGRRITNQDGPSPLRRDSSTEAAKKAIKEARDLKHLADRLKKGNGSSESTGLYFEAAMKFLHGASLLETGNPENMRHVDMLESVKIYSSTAKLCEFCAREYEKSKDMATAALAYKCMEVAYMRVIYISQQSTSRDRHELQTVLQIVPPGESPSSSASDIDSLNNSATGGKAPRARSNDSPQLTADLVITSRSHPIFERLLNFTQNVNLAMEASRKSRTSFTAASVKMDQLDSKQGIASIKRALDFNFHDVDGLLRLVRLAKEVSGR